MFFTYLVSALTTGDEKNITLIRYRQKFDSHQVTAMNLFVYLILLLTALIITDVKGMINSYFLRL